MMTKNKVLFPFILITGLVFLWGFALNLDPILIALFMIVCELAALETAANPHATALGNPETDPFRLNSSNPSIGWQLRLAPQVGVKVIMTKGYSDRERTQ